MFGALARIPGWPPALQPLARLACCAGTAAAAAAFSTSHLGTSMPAPQSLDEIMKVDQLQGRTPDEVEDIWMQACDLPPCFVCQALVPCSMHRYTATVHAQAQRT